MLNVDKLKLARLLHSQRSLGRPLALLVIVFTIYIVLCAAIIVSPPWVSFLLGLPCGLVIGDLFIIGHDACHQSFISLPRLNSLIGRICFLPSFHSYSLWDHGHNRIHHRYNNIKGLDYVWSPMSPDEYQSASLLIKLRYRFFRSFVGMPFYYMFEIWFPKMVVPRSSVVGVIKLKHHFDTACVLGFACGQVTIVGATAYTIERNIIDSIFLTVFVPFVVYNLLMSSVIYVHHTHPNVPWYRTVEEWKRRNGAILGTVHVKFPLLMRIAILDIAEHNAHHYAPGIPLYNLRYMQDELDTCSAEVVSWDFSVVELFKIVSRCKLYNFDTESWEGYANPSRNLERQTLKQS